MEDEYITFDELGRKLGVKESDLELFAQHMVEFQNAAWERETE